MCFDTEYHQNDQNDLVIAIMTFISNKTTTNDILICPAGNLCVDKKASAMNWINNRGYHVTCDVTLPSDVIASTLKTTASALVELNIGKNFIGSSLAGCIGGNNAHSANIVSGIYLATGQDIAQAGTSSMALVHMEEERGGALYVSVTMPCIEVRFSFLDLPSFRP